MVGWMNRIYLLCLLFFPCFDIALAILLLEGFGSRINGPHSGSPIEVKHPEIRASISFGWEGNIVDWFLLSK
jgi:hypothetical protein